MASGEASLIVRIVDNASKGLRDVAKQVKGMSDVFFAAKAVVGAFQTTFGTLFRFMQDSITAFAQQETAVAKLENSLRNQGVTSKAAAKEQVKFAESLQATTTFADEAIIEGQALLATFGLTGDKLKEATKASLDFSAGLGIDLKTAMLLVGKAAAGDTATLSRYGIKIKEGTKESEKLSAVLDALNSKFGGAAQAQANTYAGQMEQLKNKFSDLQERIGQEAIPVMQAWIRWVNAGIDAVGRFMGVSNQDASVRELAIDKLKKERDAIRFLVEEKIKHQENFGEQFSKMTNELRIKTDLINKLKEEIALEESLGKAKRGGLGAQPVDEEREREKQKLQEELDLHGFGLAEKARMEIESLTMTGDQRAALKAEQLAQELEMDGQFEAAKELRDAQADADHKKRVQERAAAAMLALNALASLQNSKNKEMAAVGKAAGLAMTIIHTAQGAMGAYSALSSIPIIGPALGAAAAAAVIAAGMEQQAKIRGTQMAEGGIVMPRPGGTQATIGEAGKAEAVIPLGDSRAQGMLEGLGGGVTINLYAQYADRAAFSEFVDKIDEELFRRGRNGKSFS